MLKKWTSTPQCQPSRTSVVCHFPHTAARSVVVPHGGQKDCESAWCFVSLVGVGLCDQCVLRYARVLKGISSGMGGAVSLMRVGGIV